MPTQRLNRRWGVRWTQPLLRAASSCRSGRTMSRAQEVNGICDPLIVVSLVHRQRLFPKRIRQSLQAAEQPLPTRFCARHRYQPLYNATKKLCV